MTKPRADWVRRHFFAENTKATEGIIASSDCESDEKYNAETAEEFLAWWGDRQIDFYGEDAFRNRMGETIQVS